MNREKEDDTDEGRGAQRAKDSWQVVVRGKVLDCNRGLMIFACWDFRVSILIIVCLLFSLLNGSVCCYCAIFDFTITCEVYLKENVSL